jgi:zinc D-Ala-D-Ala carboxypeptidase
MTIRTALRCLLFIAILFLAACQQQAALPSTLTITALPSSTDTPTATSTLVPTETMVPSPTLFLLPTFDTLIVSCSARRPAPDDLWTVVTAAFGLDPHYIPPDLVRLGNYLPGSVTLPDMQLRQGAAQALAKLVKAMRAEGLRPTVLSAYRSYADQVVSHNHWEVVDPANADLVSATPGHSEHQLGTVVDFGSPDMPALTGSTTDEFSPLFAGTPEGSWLTEHAFEYGFAMTNPPKAQAWTGLAYEPWHYRYVGVDLATYLHASGYFLTEYLFKVGPLLPCTP